LSHFRFPFLHCEHAEPSFISNGHIDSSGSFRNEEAGRSVKRMEVVATLISRGCLGELSEGWPLE
jgi:hypothetical protein